ncbi:hypothetical protein [Nonomuraea angiospora]
MTAIADWIRPWFPAGWTGHVRADCPGLLKWVSEPAEGAGWLDPGQAIVCTTCIPSWNAECATCGDTLADDLNWEDDRPHTEGDAKQWKRRHRCQPIVRLIAPPAPKPEPVPAGQALLPF